MREEAKDVKMRQRKPGGLVVRPICMTTHDESRELNEAVKVFWDRSKAVVRHDCCVLIQLDFKEFETPRCRVKAQDS
jgi:hypothetical protein